MLRIGRMKESIYQRSVMKQLHNRKKNPPLYRPEILVVEGWTLAADRIVTNMINTFAVKRDFPSLISVTVAMPEGTEEPEFRRFTARFGELCSGEGIWAELKDARVLRGITIPLFTAAGISSGQKCKPVGCQEAGKLKPGLDVVAAGTVGCEGAAILAIEREKALLTRFAESFVNTAKGLFEDTAMPIIRDILADKNATGIAVREGGIFAGLWEMASEGSVGLEIDLSTIPIRQHTIEICEFFHRNPYKLLSGGCLLLVTEQGESLVSVLTEEGIPAAVIGRTMDGNARIIRYDDEIRYLEPPGVDEIYLV